MSKENFYTKQKKKTIVSLNLFVLTSFIFHNIHVHVAVLLSWNECIECSVPKCHASTSAARDGVFREKSFKEIWFSDKGVSESTFIYNSSCLISFCLLLCIVIIYSKSNLLLLLFVYVFCFAGLPLHGHLCLWHWVLQWFRILLPQHLP